MPMVVTVLALALVTGLLVSVRALSAPTFMFVIVAAGLSMGLLLWLLRDFIEVAAVSRERLERFARRHGLEVTTTNGEQVIRYLATTRRWRSAGLAASLVLAVAYGLLYHVLRLDFLTFFAGWFVGALIAEVRVAHLAHGPRRAASLVPRTGTAYLPEGYWRLVPRCGVLSVAATLVCVAVAVRGRPIPFWPTVAWAVAGVVITVTVRLIQRRVLRRPQPVAPPEVLAADDAIRSRSLHVLSAGGATLVLYCVLGQITVLVTALGESGATPIALGYFIAPLYGWYVATRPWPLGRAGLTPAGATT